MASSRSSNHLNCKSATGYKKQVRERVASTALQCHQSSEPDQRRPMENGKSGPNWPGPSKTDDTLAHLHTRTPSHTRARAHTHTLTHTHRHGCPVGALETMGDAPVRATPRWPPLSTQLRPASAGCAAADASAVPTSDRPSFNTFLAFFFFLRDPRPLMRRLFYLYWPVLGSNGPESVYQE